MDERQRELIGNTIKHINMLEEDLDEALALIEMFRALSPSYYFDKMMDRHDSLVAKVKARKV